MAVLGGILVALFIVFLGALRATLRRKEGEAGALSATAVIAGSVVAAGAVVALAFDDAGELRVVLALPTAALVLATSAAVLTTEALPRWVAFAGAAAALLQLPAAASIDDGTIANAVFVAWVALTSLAMLRQRGD